MNSLLNRTSHSWATKVVVGVPSIVVDGGSYVEQWNEGNSCWCVDDEDEEFVICCTRETGATIVCCHCTYQNTGRRDHADKQQNSLIFIRGRESEAVKTCLWTFLCDRAN